MKKTTYLCLLSAFFGASVSLLLQGSSSDMRTTVAQEPPIRQRLAGTPEARFAAPPRTSAGTWGDPNTAPPLGDEELTPEERVTVAVYESVNRSVVNINTMVHSEYLLWDSVAEGEGSGSVLDHQGHILTNFHVIGGAKEIQVTLFNGKNYDARLVGKDAATDIAVLKIDAPANELFPVVLGESTRLRVGQRVYAIGNPFGLERTLSTGIVSSLNRSLPNRNTNRNLRQMIQIDAALNPGNSGGPLLDSHARVIGMNTAIASKSGTSAGVGFAIPSSTIATVVPQLLQNGRVVRPDVGIARVYQTEHGLLLATLVPGGAAERAGLQGPKVVRRTKRQGLISYEYTTTDRSVADRIVAVDGMRIQTADDFLTAIERRRPGDQVIIRVVRAGKEIDVPVRLDAGE